MLSPFTENIVYVSEQVLFVFGCIICANNIKSFAQDDVGIAICFVWKVLCIYRVIHALFYAYIRVKCNAHYITKSTHEQNLLAPNSG